MTFSKSEKELIKASADLGFEIAQLKTKLAKLIEALEPFRSWWHSDLRRERDNYQLGAFLTDNLGGVGWKLQGLRLTVGDLRKVQIALRENKENP